MIEFLMAFAILILLIAVGFLVVFVRRLIYKVEFYENWIVVFKYRITSSYEMMKASDIRGAFESDDEVGDAFKNIHAVIEDLNKITSDTETNMEN